MDTWINQNNPELYLYVKGHAQVLFSNCSINESKTIDLGVIYITEYDNEMKEDRTNMPKEKMHKNSGLLTIPQIDSMLKSSPDKYDMTMKVDTITEMITRYNFGPEKPRGTTIQSFKTITFHRDMSKK